MFESCPLLVESHFREGRTRVRNSRILCGYANTSISLNKKVLWNNFVSTVVFFIYVTLMKIVQILLNTEINDLWLDPVCRQDEDWQTKSSNLNCDMLPLAKKPKFLVYENIGSIWKIP